MPYVLVCIICLYAFAHYVPTCLYILRTHVLAYLCILRAYVPDVSLLANVYAYLATIFWVCHGFTRLCTFMFYKASFLFAICFYVPRLIQVAILLWVWHKLKSWTWLEKLAEFYSIKITKNFLIQQLVGNKAKGRVSK